MYGYVRPFIPELRVAEYERYRAVYCGLCRAMGRVTGQLSRVTLSYDFTFFAAVRMILVKRVPAFTPLRCPVHPASKRLTAEDDPTLEFSAAVSALLASAKTRDDLKDERGLSRLLPGLRRPVTDSMVKKARRLLPTDAEEGMLARLEKLSEAEASHTSSVDLGADLFGEVLAHLFSLGLSDEAADTARTIGHGAGKFVYLCDAADDLAKDVKRGRYNPLAEAWGEEALSDGKPSPALKSALSVSVPLGLEAMGEAASGLDPTHPLTPIVQNIVFLGLPASLRRVLYGGETGGEGKEEAGHL